MGFADQARRSNAMRELSLSSCRLDRRYDIQERLGQGSYAEIFLARDVFASANSPHTTVVIKALNLRLQEELDSQLERTLIENFQNEAIALDRVRHPNVIARLGHGTARDLVGTVFHYLVLEYMPGGDLQHLIKREPPPLGRALGFLEQAAAGLENAHRHGIIHRDIKPQNLLLDRTNSIVKIADFGVARMSIGDAPITRVGTNLYAPPEHSPLGFTNSSAATFGSITPASDVYSFAKTAYCLLFGIAPRDFSGGRIESLPDGHELSHEHQLLLVLQRATDDEPRNRYQSISEFWTAIRSALANVDDDETETIVRRRETEPQPRVSRGFTPLPPVRPEFETIVARFPAIKQQPPIEASSPVSDYRPPVVANISNSEPGQIPVTIPTSQKPTATHATVPARRKRRILRKFVAAVFVIAISAGALYYAATLVGSYLSFDRLIAMVSGRQATATTDVYLRPAPNANNEPVGLVTKNSKVSIIATQNNWHQVDIIEQGRTPQPGMPTATRGWVNGKYLEME